MSNKYIRGKDVLVLIQKEVDDPNSELNLLLYVPIICAKSCTLTRTYEVIEKTSVASMAREYQTGLYDWGITLDGVATAVNIDPDGGDVTVFELLLNGGEEFVKVTMTDMAGTGVRELTGKVIFPTLSITGDVNEFAPFSVELKGTGPLVVAE